MIELASLDVTEVDDGYRFEMRDGTPSDLAEFVGANDNVPEAAGMVFGQWIAKSRRISLYGCVMGSGDTVEEQQASFRTRMNALLTVMNPAIQITITATNEFGVAEATLEGVQPERLEPEAIVADLYWLGYLHLTCIGSPPQWEMVAGS